MTQPLEDTRPRSVTRAALGMGGVTAISRLMGFVRVLVIAAVLGTTYLGNTFQASNSVSNVLFELLAAGALSAVLVPTFVTLIDRGDAQEADRLSNGLLGYALVILGSVALVGIVCAPLIARLLSSGAPNAAIGHEQRHLATFLLWFFIPQVVLYAFGAVATAQLYARRRFVVTAAAPIGSSVVMIVCFIAFRVLAGPNPTFQLTVAEKSLLAFAGTGGVIAFVGILVVAAHRSGFSLRPMFIRHDPALATLARLALWGVLLHAGAAMLLGAAIVVGNGVAGGVVAYQVAFVFFLAPYAIFAQPIHTAILPELANEAAQHDVDAFAGSVGWAIDRMAVLVVPVAAALVALALPIMHVVAFGQAARSGPPLLAAGLASLAVGLLPYAALLLFARAFYALDDSRTPAIVASASAVVGVVTMATLAPMTHGTARVAVLGAGHTVAYLVGAVTLGALLMRRLERPFVPHVTGIACACAIPIAIAAWIAMRRIDPAGRVATAALLLVLVVVGAAAYAWAIRRWLPAVGPLVQA
jgi:putative peptidoglycan lipid II flippase